MVYAEGKQADKRTNKFQKVIKYKQKKEFSPREISRDSQQKVNQPRPNLHPPPHLPPLPSASVNQEVLGLTFSSGVCSSLHCYWCISYKSYEDCQRNQSLALGRHGVHGCLQQHVMIRFDNGSLEKQVFYKGVLPKESCDWYKTKEATCSSPLKTCKEKCCYEDYCNKGNILDSSSNKAVFISNGVVAIGLLLVVSIAA